MILREASLLFLWALFGYDLDFGYLAQLVRGQAHLLWNREPIETILRREGFDAAVRKRLEFVQDVLAFGRAKIGLHPSDNYTTYCEIGSGPVCWALIACPKDRLDPLKWSYPIVGVAPYRGYFDLQLAEQDQEKLESEGYDTFLRPVSAYSTLGWFSDPILSSMLRFQDADLASLLIHELTHATIWIMSDAGFNESLATFVGETGSLYFLESKHGHDSPEVQEVVARRADRRAFLVFMAGLVKELQLLYDSDRGYEEKLREREKIFVEARSSFFELPMRTDSYTVFPQWEMNNARLASFRTYTERLDLFEEVYLAAGNDLKAAVKVFVGCRDLEDPRGYLEAWIRNHSRRSGVTVRGTG